MYMAPEIAKGEADLDGRTDVFSLGIILFEMITLQFLFKGEDPYEIKKKILNQPLPLPREVAPNRLIPRDLEALCMKALKRNKYDRYASVADLLKDLQHFRHDEEVSVYWYSGWEKLTRWRSRHAYLVLVLISAGIGAGLHALFNQ
jgi:serine/threonine protein kinase